MLLAFRRLQAESPPRAAFSVDARDEMISGMLRR